MIGFAKRNIKLFFRDKASVFFSMLAVFIIIGLYLLFLGDVWTSGLPDIKHANVLMNSWIMAGLLAVTSVTTTMGAFGIMIEDKTKKIYKDFYSSPVSRSSITGGYIASAFVIGIIMSAITLVLAEAYIVIIGGSLLSPMAFLQVFGLLVLSSFTSTSMILFIVSFFKSQNAFATASSIIGTLIGFITGIYLPIGTLPEAVQVVVKVFPISHAASLFRQVIMQAPMSEAFSGAPAATVAEFERSMGITYQLSNYNITPFLSIAFLVFCGMIFYSMALIKTSAKSRKL